ncbi:hypothetical protein M0804_002980 [Polistes exclamans]|nr:hypothetical protein M0804_002980 [Polistes exclamans]
MTSCQGISEVCEREEPSSTSPWGRNTTTALARLRRFSNPLAAGLMTLLASLRSHIICDPPRRKSRRRSKNVATASSFFHGARKLAYDRNQS